MPFPPCASSSVLVLNVGTSQGSILGLLLLSLHRSSLVSFYFSYHLRQMTSKSVSLALNSSEHQPHTSIVLSHIHCPEPHPSLPACVTFASFSLLETELLTLTLESASPLGLPISAPKVILYHSRLLSPPHPSSCSQLKSPTPLTFKIVLKFLTFLLDSHDQCPGSCLNLCILSHPFCSL